MVIGELAAPTLLAHVTAAIKGGLAIMVIIIVIMARAALLAHVTAARKGG